MPMRFAVTRQDMLRSKVVAPGWYTCKITKVEQVAAKTDGSLNTNIEVEIKDGVYAGTPIKRTFSEKAAGFAVPFIEAVLRRPMRPEGEEIDAELAKGRDISCYVLNDKYQGRLVNKLEDFKAV